MTMENFLDMTQKFRVYKFSSQQNPRIRRKIKHCVNTICFIILSELWLSFVAHGGHFPTFLIEKYVHDKILEPIVLTSIKVNVICILVYSKIFISSI